MEKFLEQMSEIFEVDQVKPSDEIVEFETWDSLASLSIIVLSDEEYGVSISAHDIRKSKTIEGLFKLIQTKKQ